MNTDEQVITQTRKWVVDVVVGCNFCPFAATPVKRDTIHYQVDRATDLEGCLTALLAEWHRLDAHPEIENTLLIFPDAYPEFTDYLDLVAMAEDLLAAEDYEGTYQVAGFHPDYCFGDAPPDDPANYTNRSIYPMLHLIREEGLEEVLAHYKDPDGIPDRNIAFAREKGLAYLKMLRAACL
ncbi:DUF1415 domain-containing protein [uncultured Thiodictyon sp.]|uniref:DUF1415 domain-containing protein n=1 Tax=uncultured Thiodictyon sp. TaxID=1846217 RepID=UPI0025FF153B|nr:DUF1415 domain-containing protein [uncultured Thiodictyon sp.]